MTAPQYGLIGKSAALYMKQKNSLEVFHRNNAHINRMLNSDSIKMSDSKIPITIAFKNGPNQD